MPKTHEEFVVAAQNMFAPDIAAAIADEFSAQSGHESMLTLGLSDQFFSELGTGVVEGLPTTTWTGMDEFVYIPDPNRPFSYTTSQRLGARTITPRQMPTDGGTVPRILRGKASFSSWGYTPAFIIHDWIFYSKRFGLGPDGAASFEDSADILAEVIKTLMVTGYTAFDGRLRKLPQNEDALYLIYLGVASRVARNLWNRPTSWDELAPGGLASLV